jgi:hypothetical protein
MILDMYVVKFCIYWLILKQTEAETFIVFLYYNKYDVVLPIAPNEGLERFLLQYAICDTHKTDYNPSTSGLPCFQVVTTMSFCSILEMHFT